MPHSYPVSGGFEMKRRVLGFALLVSALGLTATSASGFGGKRSAPCGTTSGCGAPCATVAVSYVDKKVMVNEWVTVKEDYKYWVNEPEKKKEKVKVKEAKTGEEKFKYSVMELVTVKEKVKVGEYKAVTKEVEVVSYTLVPKVTKQKRTVCEWVCVPVVVTCTVAPPAPRGGLFSRLCGKKHNDCDSCNTCAAPCPQVVTKTVMQRQMITKEIEVDVTTYDRIEKKEKKPVTTHELVWVEKEVEVKKCVPVEKEGKRPTVTWVDVEKEVEVVTYKKVEKTGTREVKKCVQVEKTVKVAVYTTVAAAPCATPCATPCSTGMSGGCGSARGGLFRGHGGCCR